MSDPRFPEITKPCDFCLKMFETLQEFPSKFCDECHNNMDYLDPASKELILILLSRIQRLELFRKLETNK